MPTLTRSAAAHAVAAATNASIDQPLMFLGPAVTC